MTVTPHAHANALARCKISVVGELAASSPRHPLVRGPSVSHALSSRRSLHIPPLPLPSNTDLVYKTGLHRDFGRPSTPHQAISTASALSLCQAFALFTFSSHFDCPGLDFCPNRLRYPLNICYVILFIHSHSLITPCLRTFKRFYSISYLRTADGRHRPPVPRDGNQGRWDKMGMPIMPQGAPCERLHPYWFVLPCVTR